MVIDVTLDADAERTVRRLWHALDDEGFDVSRQIVDRPHVTLFVASEGSPREIGERLAEHDWSNLPPISFGAIGYFGNPGQVLYLAVTPTATLLELHERIWRLVTPLAPVQSPFYQPGMWTPHCTLAHGLSPERVGCALRAVDALPRLVTATPRLLRAHSWADDSRWVTTLPNRNSDARISVYQAADPATIDALAHRTVSGPQSSPTNGPATEPTAEDRLLSQTSR